MPTKGRKEWAAQAVKCFFAQTYPNKELIILQDEDDPSFDEDFSNREVHLGHSSLSIPRKRNEAISLAHGEIIMHFDSDDWSSPDRMTSQVHLLEESRKAMAAFHSMLFHVEPSGPSFKYIGMPYYGIGTSLCYSKEWIRLHPFPENVTEGEDNAAVKLASEQGQLISVDAGSMMVARIHNGNTSYKDFKGTEYRHVPTDCIPTGFFL
jgi:glycosyltransferase involved in cell wall biosynthesis